MEPWKGSRKGGHEGRHALGLNGMMGLPLVRTFVPMKEEGRAGDRRRFGVDWHFVFIGTDFRHRFRKIFLACEFCEDGLMKDAIEGYSCLRNVTDTKTPGFPRVCRFDELR
jgi:hypothetical protein